MEREMPTSAHTYRFDILRPLKNFPSKCGQLLTGHGINIWLHYTPLVVLLFSWNWPLWTILQVSQLWSLFLSSLIWGKHKRVELYNYQSNLSMNTCTVCGLCCFLFWRKNFQGETYILKAILKISMGITWFTQFQTGRLCSVLITFK